MDCKSSRSRARVALSRPAAPFNLNIFLPALILVSVVTGCAHPGLNAARENFYLGRFDEASENLQDIPEDKKNRILLLMERGTIMQAAQKYEDSTRDWVTAWELGRELDYYSLTEGTASFVVNDRVQSFQGMPYERTLLHSFAALSYFAMEMWDDAAVEARNIIRRQSNLDDFPDDAFSRYIAGFCMEMIYNDDSAMREYQTAAELLNGITIDEQGRIIPTNTAGMSSSDIRHGDSELVCFISIGRSPAEYGSYPMNYRWGPDPYAEIYAGDKYLGRSYCFANTQKLLASTQKRLAGLRAMKDITRIALKEIAAQTVSSRNEYLGEILRLVLYSFEATSERRWETLPLWLHVARVRCPQDISEYRVIFKNSNGKTIQEKNISAPITGRGNIRVSFCRDIRKTGSSPKSTEPQKQ